MTNEPNPPPWPNSVHILRETDDMTNIRDILKSTEDGWNDSTYTSEYHFSTRRHALLFAPGVYQDLDFEVGYYVQVAGLGISPDSVQFENGGPHVPALNRHIHPSGSSLDTFWRSAENFTAQGNMMWAVSQAAPLRRVHVAGNLYLTDGDAYASGGYLANASVDGTTYFGGQQQWMNRNVHFDKGAIGGAWSLVFVGCTGEVPMESPGHETAASITVTPTTPVRIEKPYIALQSDGIKFDLRVPLPIQDERYCTGPLLDGSFEDVRDFSRVHVARADDADVTGSIQQALDQGKDVVLAAGIFQLSKTLVVQVANQVILGIGLATLMAPPDGLPCIRVAPHTPGVRIAGIVLEASTRLTQAPTEVFSSLLEFGSEDVPDSGVAENPGALLDVFCRVGGATAGDRSRIHVDAMMRIHSGNVIGDNLWLWRADHGILGDGEAPNYPDISGIYHQTEDTEFRVKAGIEVYGDDVTVYGLAVEHANGHQTIWSGERGAVHFYQCELPYDVTQETFGDVGFLGYLIEGDVQEHGLHGAGIYSNFRNEEVKVVMAIQHPERLGIRSVNPFTVRLDNNGRIESIVNGQGEPATTQGIPSRI